VRTVLGALDCLASGITAVQDMPSLNPSNAESYDSVMRAYRDVGIRVAPSSLTSQCSNLCHSDARRFRADCMVCSTLIQVASRRLGRPPKHWRMWPTTNTPCQLMPSVSNHRTRRAAKPITPVAEAATLAHPRGEPLATAAARTEAIRLARRILELDTALEENMARISELVEASSAAELLYKTGIGPVTAARTLVVWSHPGRVSSEAAFVAIAGVNPIPASLGNTTRHRLNRGGDRQLNSVLNVIAMVRIVHDPVTRPYVERRRREGKTDHEIRRILKRYLDRTIKRHLNTASTEKPGVMGYRSVIGDSTAASNTSAAQPSGSGT